MSPSYLLAIVQIVCPSGSAGSGVTVYSDKINSHSYILTAKHVVSSDTMCRVYTTKNDWHPGRIIQHGRNYDQSLIRVNRELPYIPLSDRHTECGDTVTAYGYGGSGPLGRLWRFQSPVVGYDNHLDRIILQPGSISGDSGGPIIQLINNRPYVVGLVTGGELYGYNGAAKNTHGPNAYQLNALLNTIVSKDILHQQGYYPNREPVQKPSHYPVSPIQKPDPPLPTPPTRPPGGISPQDPPSTFPGISPQDPPCYCGGECPNCGRMRCGQPEIEIGDTSIGEEADVTAVKSGDKITLNFVLPEGKPGAPGETGPPGPPGEPGVVGPPGLTPDPVTIQALIDNRIKEMMPDIPPAWSHMVLVAEVESSYYRPMQNAYRDTKGDYSKIYMKEAEGNVSPVPILVAYSAGKPLTLARGTEEVYNVLRDIRNGKYDKYIHPNGGNGESNSPLNTLTRKAG